MGEVPKMSLKPEENLNGASRNISMYLSDELWKSLLKRVSGLVDI